MVKEYYFFVSADNGFIYQVIKYTNGFVETIV